MKKILLYTIILISVFLIIGVFHDEYGEIFEKIILFWAVLIAVYSLFINKKEILDKK
jgi:hypothetical protein